MTDKAQEIGFTIIPVTRYGARYIEARVCARKDGCDYPRVLERPTFGADPLSDLALIGHFYSFSTTDVRFLGFEPEYRDAFVVDAARAIAMGKTLTKINKRLEKDVRGHEPGDVLASVGKSIGATFCAFRGTPNAETQWFFTDMLEGKRRLREMIAREHATALKAMAA